jgi:PAS domain S-box-containing protein
MNTKIKILIAEHDPVDLELLNHELKNGGIDYEYKAVHNELDYINALKNFIPDIILADYTFPSFDGPTAFKIKEKIAPCTPFIFVSGTIGEEKSIELIKNGVTDYVLKESLFTLASKVKRALKESEDAIEKKGLEKAFESERERFHNLFLQAPTSMGILKGPDHIFEIANPLYMELIGKRELIGKTVKEVMPELEEQGFIELLDGVYKTGETFQANEMLVQLDQHGNGQLTNKYLNFIYQAYRNSEGLIEGIFFFAVDVTEQVLSRKKIEESENRFRVIIEKSSEMIALSSKDGKMFYISPSAAHAFGYSLKDINQVSSFNFIHPDDVKKFAEGRKEILETDGRSYSGELRLLHKNGNWIWCEATLTNMLNEPGVNAMVSNFRDISEKKVVEQQLEFNNNNLNALINNTNDLLWSVDRDFNLITFNQPFDDIVKLMSGKRLMKGMNVLSIAFPEKQLERFKEFYERAFRGEDFREIEFSGAPIEFWSEISFFPIRKGDEVIGTACHSRDITEQKKAEDQIRKKERQWAVIFNTISDSIFMLSVQSNNSFKFISVNPTFLRSTGLSEEQVIGQYVNKVIPSPSLELALSKYNEAITKRGTINWEEKTEYPSGIQTGFVSISPVIDEKNICTMLVGSVHDITERKKTEEEMKRLANRLQMATISAGMGIWDWDIEKDKLAWDERMHQLYKINSFQFEAVYDDWISRLHHEDKDRVNEEIQMAVTGKKEFDTEFRIIWDDSTVHYIKATGIIENNEAGNPSRMIGINWEITDRKLNEIRLKELNENLMRNTKYLATSNAELEQFAYVASHDLQEPLRMITSFLAQLEKKYGDVIDDKGKKYISFAVDGARRMRQIILDLLEFSLVGSAEDEMEELDLNELLDEIKILLRIKIEDKKAVIIIDTLPQIHAHRSPLRQVFQNLIGNALKYSKKDIPAQIHIKVADLTDHWQFSVSDNGIGIEKEYFDKIFVIFQRLHSKDDFSGTGMGLAITKKIIETWDGKIWLESEQGKGTTFYFILPKNKMITNGKKTQFHEN